MAVEHGNHIIGPMHLPDTDPIAVLDTQELGSEPSVHGLMLFRELLDAAVTGDCAFYARVTVHAGNTSTSFLCDWSGQCALVCQRLQVEAVPYWTREDNGGATDPSAGSERYKHGAMVGFGGWHAARPMTFTGAERQINSITTPIDIPLFARRVFLRISRLVSVDPPWAPFYGFDQLGIRFKRTPFGRADSAYADDQILTPEHTVHGIDMSGVGALNITCRNAGPSLIVTPVFELGL
jgi:hypothetical protein